MTAPTTSRYRSLALKEGKEIQLVIFRAPGEHLYVYHVPDGGRLTEIAGDEVASQGSNAPVASRICITAIRAVLDDQNLHPADAAVSPGGEMRYECRIFPLANDEILAIVRDTTAEVESAEELQQLQLSAGVNSDAGPLEIQRDRYHLTTRELTVLHLLARGSPDKRIAEDLGISTYTVNKHVANILGKMQAVSRTDAAVRAQREGLVH